MSSATPSAGSMALALATAHPERVDQLVPHGSGGCPSRSPPVSMRCGGTSRRWTPWVGSCRTASRMTPPSSPTSWSRCAMPRALQGAGAFRDNVPGAAAALGRRDGLRRGGPEGHPTHDSPRSRPGRRRHPGVDDLTMLEVDPATARRTSSGHADTGPDRACGCLRGAADHTFFDAGAPCRDPMSEHIVIEVGDGTFLPSCSRSRHGQWRRHRPGPGDLRAERVHPAPRAAARRPRVCRPAPAVFLAPGTTRRAERAADARRGACARRPGRSGRPPCPTWRSHARPARTGEVTGDVGIVGFASAAGSASRSPPLLPRPTRWSVTAGRPCRPCSTSRPR